METHESLVSVPTRLLVLLRKPLLLLETYKQLNTELEKKECSLARIERLLRELEEQGFTCPSLISDKLLTSFFSSIYQSSNFEAQKVQVLKIWIRIKGDYNYAGALDDIVKSLYVFEPTERHTDLQMFEALVTEGGLNVRSKITTESGEQLSILYRILTGVRSWSIEGFRFILNINFLDFLLEKGAGRDLVPTINMRVGAFTKYEAERRSSVPELFAIWDILKEAKLKLQKTDFTNISKEQATEIEIIGEKIAKLYLYCKEEGITADEINNNKDWVLGFINSPVDLKCLAAKTIKSYTKEEDINKLILPTSLKTFVEDPVISSAIKPVEVKK